MSTNAKHTEEEVKLDTSVAEGYSPEVETSIWYN